MRLNQEQKKIFESHLIEKLKEDNDCSACGKNLWSFDAQVYGLFQMGLESETESIGLIPLITTTCKNCAGIRFFHAQHAGIEIPGVTIGDQNESDNS